VGADLKEPGEFRFTLGVAVLLLLTQQIRPRRPCLSFSRDRQRHQLPVEMDHRSIPGPTNCRALMISSHLRFTRSGMGSTDCFISVIFVFHRATNARRRHSRRRSSLHGGRECGFFNRAGNSCGNRTPAENAHYASDVIGAVGFAILGTTLLHKALAGWLKPAQKLGET